MLDNGKNGLTAYGAGVVFDKLNYMAQRGCFANVCTLEELDKTRKKDMANDMHRKVALKKLHRKPAICF